MPEDETLMMHDMETGDDNFNPDIGLTTVAPNVVPTLFDDQPTVMNNINATTNDHEGPMVAKKQKMNDEEKKTNAAGEEIEDDTSSEVSDLLKKSNEMNPQAQAVEKQIRAKRRRKLIIDEVKEIDSNTMKAQLSDTSGILGSLELAPPTRQLMYMKENGVVDKLFSMTSRPLHSKVLQKVKILFLPYNQLY